MEYYLLQIINSHFILDYLNDIFLLWELTSLYNNVAYNTLLYFYKGESIWKILFFVIISVHLIYFIFWFFTNKIKNSHLQIVREWDNGYEFYETLNPIDKENIGKKIQKI